VSPTLTLADVETYNGGSLRRSGKYLRGKCPVHGGNSPTSFQYNPETGHWKCFKCGEWGYIRDGATTRPAATAMPEPQKQEIKPVRSALAELMAKYQTALPGSPGEEYLKKRGISLELAQKHGAGYGEFKQGIWRVVFPHTSPSGEIISIYGRAIDDNVKLKHKHMAGNKGVFNAATLSCGMVFLCEGPFDALSLIAAGHENTCAIFGNTGLSNKWQWVKAKILIFCFDDDTGGEKWKQLAAEATLKGKKVYFLEKECYQGYKDLNEVWVKTGRIDVGDLPEPPDEREKAEEPSSEAAPSPHHEESFLSILQELSLSPAEPNTTRPEQADLCCEYLTALNVRIQSLEAEYTAEYRGPVPEEAETCRELSTKAFYPAEQGLKYLKRYEALAAIERLKQEHETAIEEGRNYWTPGPLDKLLKQKRDGSFFPASRDELDQVVPTPAHEAEYDQKTGALIIWFQEHKDALSREPFILRLGVKTDEPEKFYAALMRDIGQGPGFVRAGLGALSRELSELRELFGFAGEDEWKVR